MRIEDNYDLTLHNSYRIKALCKRAFFPSQKEDFIKIYKENKGDSKIILGGGFNVIFSKDYYDNDFIILGESFAKAEVKGRTIKADAGIDLKSLSELALSNGLSGMEIFYDIPSSLGGAVVMNAGASGEEIKDILVQVEYLDLEDLTLKISKKEDMGFDYRNSFFQRNTDKIVLTASLLLKEGKPAEIRKKMEKIKELRWAKQPKEFPNAGSVFKRPKGFYVGAMIEELGLKGFSVGGAKISEKHGGFIVNYNQAKGKDILEIINQVKNLVQEKYGVDLEVEQRIIE